MLEQGLPEFPPSILAREDSEECISISPYFYVCDLKDAASAACDVLSRCGAAQLII